MTIKPLSEYSIDELHKELDNRNIIQSIHDKEYELNKTDKFLKASPIGKNRDKYVTVPADSIMIVLDALKGNADVYKEHYTLNNMLFHNRDIVTLLEEAMAQLNEPIVGLDKYSNNYQIDNFFENTEVIAEVTLSDIASIAIDIIIEYTEFDKLGELTKEQNQEILTEIIGKPLNEFRDELYVYNLHILDMIEPHIRKAIMSKLEPNK